MNNKVTGFHYEKDSDSIVTITMDMDGLVNAMNSQCRKALVLTLDRLEGEVDLKGVVITSAKKTFFSGSDLHELLVVPKGGEPELFDMIDNGIKLPLRRLETLSVPVVAAINGSALGEGMELCLACHYRVALNTPTLALGFPEVTLGLLPGSGGIVRSVYMMGLARAMPQLLDGRMLSVSEAQELGYVDAVVTTLNDLVPYAKQWISSHPRTCVQPWDLKNYQIPDNIPSRVQVLCEKMHADLQRKTKGLLPAPGKILAVAQHCLSVPFAEAMRNESYQLAQLITTAEAKNLMTSTFFHRNAVTSGQGLPMHIKTATVTKVGIIGQGELADTWGSIASQVGLEVFTFHCSDVNFMGFNTDDFKSLTGCDVVFDTLMVDFSDKKVLLQRLETYLSDTGILLTCVNEQSLNELSADCQYPEKIVGFHLNRHIPDSPVVEILCSERCCDETLVKSFRYLRQLRKTPIVLNDGIDGKTFIGRVIKSYCNEHQSLLDEGVDPRMINTCITALDLGHLAAIYHSLAATDKAQAVYADLPLDAIKDRLLFRPVIESLYCLQEGLLRSVPEANVCMVLTGLAPTWTGGFIQFINSFGLLRFIHRCNELADCFGPSFKAPNIVTEKLAIGGLFN